jgi:hypothetical protein
MKRLSEILCRPVANTRFMHDRGHALIAAGIAAFFSWLVTAGGPKRPAYSPPELLAVSY